MGVGLWTANDTSPVQNAKRSTCTSKALRRSCRKRRKNQMNKAEEEKERVPPFLGRWSRWSAKKNGRMALGDTVKVGVGKKAPARRTRAASSLSRGESTEDGRAASLSPHRGEKKPMTERDGVVAQPEAASCGDVRVCVRDGGGGKVLRAWRGLEWKAGSSDEGKEEPRLVVPQKRRRDRGDQHTAVEERGGEWWDWGGWGGALCAVLLSG